MRLDFDGAEVAVEDEGHLVVVEDYVAALAADLDGVVFGFLLVQSRQ